LVIILSSGGSPLGQKSLDDLPRAAIRWQRVEYEDTAACVAARVGHDDAPDEFARRVRGWGRARGWIITVAPSRQLG
jgi:hypothetical protein